ncbi:MAG: sugar phosphate isomerase/epimerase [Chloroflexota bacterium]|nr:sugar phosphate isomerase/epimerase [Chloroflexota bacterium]
MNTNQIGIQLYTIREAAAADLDAALGRVAEIGYTAVEFAGFQGLTAPTVKGLLDKHGLKAAAAHVPLSDFRNRLDGVIDDLTTIEAEWGIVPSVPSSDRSEAGMLGLGREFDAYAERLQTAGIKFAYHNHDFEFSETTANGKTLFDTMVEITTPGLVYFELDAFWAAVGGFDPSRVISQNAERIGLVHLKDGPEGGVARGNDVPFGEGTLDWDGILAAARAAGVSWYITEQDNPNPEDPFGDVATALKNAKAAAQ